MKKLFAVLISALLIASVFAPACFATGDDAIEYINIDYVLEPGEKLSKTKFIISASLTSAPENILEMTENFTIEEIKWYKSVKPEELTDLDETDYYADEIARDNFRECASTEEVDEGAIYKIALSSIKASDGTPFNLYVPEERIMINNTPIIEIGGSDVLSDGSNLDVSFYCTVAGYVSFAQTTTEPETISETVITTTEPEVTEKVEEKCNLCGICPFQPMGVCLFIWIGVIVAGLIVILLLVKSLLPKKED